MSKIKNILHSAHQHYHLLMGTFFATALPMFCSGAVLWTAYALQYWLPQAQIAQLLLVYAVLGLLMGLALIPTTLAATLGGFFWDWEALLFMTPAYLLAAGISYHIAHLFPTQKLLAQPKAQAMLHRVQHAPFSTTVYAKLSPALPFALSNFLLAWAKIPLRTFLMGSAIGMLPRTALATWVGRGLQNIAQAGTLPSEGKAVLVLLFAASAWGLYGLFIKKAP